MGFMRKIFLKYITRPRHQPALRKSLEKPLLFLPEVSFCKSGSNSLFAGDTFKISFHSFYKFFCIFHDLISSFFINGNFGSIITFFPLFSYIIKNLSIFYFNNFVFYEVLVENSLNSRMFRPFKLLCKQYCCCDDEQRIVSS